MGKIVTYLLVMSGLTLIFYFTGLIGVTPNSTLLNLLLSPEGMQTSTFATNVVIAIQALALAGAVVLGTLFGRSAELLAMSSFTIFVFNLGWDFLVVFNKIREVAPFWAIMIFAPILLLYMVTIIEFWRGRD